MLHSQHQNPILDKLRLMAEKTPQRTARERLTFEEAFTRLEQTVQALEAGGLTLEEATGLYEEGMRLARVCNELLSATELRVTRLQSSFGEQMRFLGAGDSQEESASEVSPQTPSEALDGDSPTPDRES